MVWLEVVGAWCCKDGNAALMGSIGIEGARSLSCLSCMKKKNIHKSVVCLY